MKVRNINHPRTVVRPGQLVAFGPAIRQLLDTPCGVVRVTASSRPCKNCVFRDSPQDCKLAPDCHGGLLPLVEFEPRLVEQIRDELREAEDHEQPWLLTELKEALAVQHFERKT